MTGSIVLNGVSKTYGVTHALVGVSVELKQGEIHALLGENGSGKSTVIKILSGTIDPDEGTISRGGEVLRLGSPDLARRSGIATVYQDLSVLLNLTVGENIFIDNLPRTRLGDVDNAKLHQRAERLLSELGIAGIAVDSQCSDLSLAQLQLVELARAVSRRPSVLLLDEATSALDRQEAELVLGVCRRLAHEGAVVVFVSHRLDEVIGVAHRISVLRDGILVASDGMQDVTPDQLLEAMLGGETSELIPSHQRTTVGAPLLRVDVPAGKWLRQRASLVARAGEIVGLAGLQGHGQKSFLRILAGDIVQPGTTVELAGKRIDASSSAKAIANGIYYVAEERKVEGILTGHSVATNMSLSSIPAIRRMGLLSKSLERRRTEQMGSRLTIRMASCYQSIDSLSGGNQQKVLLGRALLAEPQVLLLDDPTRGIDIGAKRDVYQLLQSLAEQGVTVIINSSDILEFIGLCDRVLVFNSGVIIDELSGPEISEARILGAMFGKVQGAPQ